VSLASATVSFASTLGRSSQRLCRLPQRLCRLHQHLVAIPSDCVACLSDCVACINTWSLYSATWSLFPATRVACFPYVGCVWSCTLSGGSSDQIEWQSRDSGSRSVQRFRLSVGDHVYNIQSPRHAFVRNLFAASL
jgi:hypothetical protein